MLPFKKLEGGSEKNGKVTLVRISRDQMLHIPLSSPYFTEVVTEQKALLISRDHVQSVYQRASY